jgi:hypothetical protein
VFEPGHHVEEIMIRVFPLDDLSAERDTIFGV